VLQDTSVDRVSDLVAAVAAAPDDDAPRLVYADWLIERGDPLGELVALQCALARAEAADEGMEGEARAIERERALRRMNEDRWFGPLRAIAEAGWVMRRGFVEHMTAWRARDFVDHAAEIVGRAPLLRSLAIGGEVVLASVPELRGLTELVLEEAGPLEVASFHPFVVGQLPGLKRLELANVTRDRESAQAVVELPAETVELEHLGYCPRRVVGQTPTKQDAIPWVLRAIAGRHPRLRSLALGRCYGLALDGLDEMTQLESLALEDCAIGAQVAALPRGLVSLTIEHDQLAVEDVARLLARLPRLRRLRLRYDGLRDEHADAIATAAPESLRRLDVGSNLLEDEGARTLLGLTQLVRLDLAGNPNVKAALVNEAKGKARVRYRPELPGVPEDILTDLARGNKIGAIKRYREITSLGLANALHAIERISDERS
jgi:uncharacterized protein (TIGR02996 family)